MSKTLISIDNIDQFICCNKLMVDSSKILTPGARDELTRRGVEIVYGEGGCDCHGGATGHGAEHGAASACAAGAAHTTCGGSAGCHDAAHYDEDMLIGVAAIIKQHYGITDPEVLRKVTLETAAAIAKGNK